METKRKFINYAPVNRIDETTHITPLISKCVDVNAGVEHKSTN